MVTHMVGWQVGPGTDKVDYLVIGSGFGGSVAAATLAEKVGRTNSVCVLERGKAYPPGSFPRRLRDVIANFWGPSAGFHGMYQFWKFDRIDAITASGLGGGSLIYANVMLEKPTDWFTQKTPCQSRIETWSFDHEDLAPHYKAVREVLRVQYLPDDFAADRSPKTADFLAASENRGQLAPVAVRFSVTEDNPQAGHPLPEEKYGNVHGAVQRTTCQMKGECDVGCNVGAKSTMDHTYLSIAAKCGATICIRTEVREIHRCSDGSPYLFNIGYVIHPAEAEGIPRTEEPELQWIRAKRLVLAAGTAQQHIPHAGQRLQPADS